MIYYGKDNGYNLQHWKYISKHKGKNGKWVYVYNKKDDELKKTLEFKKAKENTKKAEEKLSELNGDYSNNLAREYNKARIKEQKLAKKLKKILKKKGKSTNKIKTTIEDNIMKTRMKDVNDYKKYLKVDSDGRVKNSTEENTNTQHKSRNRRKYMKK